MNPIRKKFLKKTAKIYCTCFLLAEIWQINSGATNFSQLKTTPPEFSRWKWLDGHKSFFPCPSFFKMRSCIGNTLGVELYEFGYVQCIQVDVGDSKRQAACSQDPSFRSRLLKTPKSWHGPLWRMVEKRSSLLDIDDINWWGAFCLLRALLILELHLSVGEDVPIVGCNHQLLLYQLDIENAHVNGHYPFWKPSPLPFQASSPPFWHVKRHLSDSPTTAPSPCLFIWWSSNIIHYPPSSSTIIHALWAISFSTRLAAPLDTARLHASPPSTVDHKHPHWPRAKTSVDDARYHSGLYSGL